MDRIATHRILINGRVNRTLIWILMFMAFMVFAICLTLLILLITLHAQAPQWGFKEIHVKELDTSRASDCDGAAACLKTTIEVKILAHNPIKKRRMFYEDIRIGALLLGGVQVGGEYVIEPFYQDSLETSTIRVVFGSNELIPLDAWTWKRLQQEVGERVLRVQIRIRGRTIVKIMKWVKQRFKFVVECDADFSIPRDSPSTTFPFHACTDKT